MTVKKSKTTSRTKSGSLNKNAVAKAVKIISTTRGKETSSKQSTFVCRNAQSGKFVKTTEKTYAKTSKTVASSKLRTKSGTLKREIVKNAIESVTQSRPTHNTKK